MATEHSGASAKPEEDAKLDGKAKELFVEGWEFMQTLGEGAYGEYAGSS